MNEGQAISEKKASQWLRKKWILAVAAALILIISSAAVWRLFRHPVPRLPQKAKAESGVKTVVHLDPFVVNLADPDSDRFLRVGIELGLHRDLAEHGQAGQSSSLPTARIRDTILMVLTTCNADALLPSAGKAKLKEDLTRALRERIPELGVEEVYFTDFIVQR